MIVIYILFAFKGLAITEPESGIPYYITVIAGLAFWVLIIRGWRLSKKNNSSMSAILKLKNDLSKSISALIILTVSATILSWIILYFAGDLVINNDGKLYALIFLIYSTPFFVYSLWKSYKTLSNSH